MPAAALTPEQSSVVANAARLLEQERAAEAANLVAPLIRAGCHHPDPLMIYSAAYEALGQINEAFEACKLAVDASPERADLWGALGRMLYENGQAPKGAELLERAVSLDPANAELWYNLALAAGDAGNLPRAIETMRRAADLRPEWANAWGGLGFFQEQAGELEEAETSLRRALQLDPTLASARHALTVTLRRLDRVEEALAVSGDAAAAETRLLRAHLLADSGSAEAAEAYKAVLEERPDLLDGHETFARLMPQIGRPEAALDTYRQALTGVPSPELYHSALASAHALGDSENLDRWAAEAEHKFGAGPHYGLYRALAARMRGDAAGALRLMEPLAAAGYLPAISQCAETALMLHDFDAAERHALAATEANPVDQSAWAVLTIAWRVKEDPRENWLADYERFVMPIEIDPPSGDRAGFMGGVASELHSLHNMSHQPADQSLREGTQTRGNLFDRRSPMVQALAGQIRRQVDERIAQLPSDPTHPFLSRKSGKAQFIGSWSVQLRSGGYHVAHIHQEGWLSSALYVELPDSIVRAGREAGDGQPSEGALTFGVPSSVFGLDLCPRRIERPEVGRLVVFPSYFWHGTLPFNSDSPRLTVAFDMVPVNPT
jgi:tetratricopeptide (TPR) repeat protein